MANHSKFMDLSNELCSRIAFTLLVDVELKTFMALSVTCKRMRTLLCHTGMWQDFLEGPVGSFRPSSSTAEQQVARRGMILTSRSSVVADAIAKHYAPNEFICYSETDLKAFLTQSTGILVDDDLLQQGLSLVSPLFKILSERIGTKWDNTTFHNFKILKTTLICQGPQNVTRFHGLQRRGSMPPPIPTHCIPRHVCYIQRSTANLSSSLVEAEHYFADTLPMNITHLHHLVNSTLMSTRLHSQTNFTTTEEHYLLPHAKDLRRRKCDWTELSIHDMILSKKCLPSCILPGGPEGGEWFFGGGRELDSMMRFPGQRRSGTMVLLGSVYADLPEFVDWVNFMEEMSDDCVIALAFSTHMDYTWGRDRRVYGRDCLDYIICVSLGELRMYASWLTLEKHASTFVPTEAQLVIAGLSAEAAHRLATLINRSGPLRGIGASHSNLCAPGRSSICLIGIN